MAMRWMLLSLLALLSAACNLEKLPERMAPRDDQQLARAAIDDLANGRTAALATKMPEQFRDELVAVAPQMRAAVPPNPTVKLVQANWTKTVGPDGSTTRQSELGYELSGGGRYAHAQLVIQRDSKGAVVAGFRIEPAAEPVQSWSSLSLKGKSGSHYAMVGAALAVLAITIGAIVRIWRSGLFPRRWLWTIGALIGLSNLTIDWSTGAFSFMPISFQLFSAGIAKTGLGPWRLGVSIPVFAIWALLRKRPPAEAEPVSE